MACHERKIRMLAKLRSDYPYQRQESEVSNQDMKYPYRRARTVVSLHMHGHIYFLLQWQEHTVQYMYTINRAVNTCMSGACSAGGGRTPFRPFAPSQMLAWQPSPSPLCHVRMSGTDGASS